MIQNGIIVYPALTTDPEWCTLPERKPRASPATPQTPGKMISNRLLSQQFSVDSDLSQDSLCVTDSTGAGGDTTPSVTPSRDRTYSMGVTRNVTVDGQGDSKGIKGEREGTNDILVSVLGQASRSCPVITMATIVFSLLIRSLVY